MINNDNEFIMNWNAVTGNISLLPGLKQKPKAEAEAIILKEPLVDSHKVYDQYYPIATRSYEEPYKWFYLVFKPLNKAYERQEEFFKYKSLDKIKDKFRDSDTYIMTRETLDCNKVHVNVLVCSTTDYIKTLKDKIFVHKWKISCFQLSSTHDRLRVLRYILKEEPLRPFELYLDYLIKKPKNFEYTEILKGCNPPPIPKTLKDIIIRIV